MESITELKDQDNTILRSFIDYELYALKKYYTPRLCKWESLSKYQQNIIPWFPEHLRAIKHGIKCNRKFFMQVVAVTVEGHLDPILKAKPPTEKEMDKVVAMIAQVAREWSADCAKERNLLLSRVRARLDKCYPRETTDRSEIIIKNPGCGTGRVAAEMALDGFDSIGIENSFQMIAVSKFILNDLIPKEHLPIYPFVHGFSHWKSRKAQVEEVRIPDIGNLKDIGMEHLMSIDYGSFVSDMGADRNIQISQEYSLFPHDVFTRLNHKHSAHVIITNFFIDTGVNILNYLQTIYYNLKPGGQWINFGPLLYHFENDDGKETVADFDWDKKEVIKMQKDVPLQGLELAADDIVSICVDKLGFELIEFESDILSGYGSPKGASGLPGYKCHYWVMERK